MRGHGPVECSQRIFDLQQTSVHGTVIWYWHEGLGKIAELFICTLSDVMNHTAQAEIAIETAGLQKALDDCESFREAWNLSKWVLDFYDTGPHYHAFAFLGHKLLVEPLRFQKTVGVQFFEFKHGKSKALACGSKAIRC